MGARGRLRGRASRQLAVGTSRDTAGPTITRTCWRTCRRSSRRSSGARWSRNVSTRTWARGAARRDVRVVCSSCGSFGLARRPRPWRAGTCALPTCPRDVSVADARPVNRRGLWTARSSAGSGPPQTPCPRFRLRIGVGRGGCWTCQSSVRPGEAFDSHGGPGAAWQAARESPTCPGRALGGLVRPVSPRARGAAAGSCHAAEPRRPPTPWVLGPRWASAAGVLDVRVVSSSRRGFRLAGRRPARHGGRHGSRHLPLGGSRRPRAPRQPAGRGGCGRCVRAVRRDRGGRRPLGYGPQTGARRGVAGTCAS